MVVDVIDSDSDWFDALAPQLRIAVAVLEEQHITRAARRLGVPQPTVTSVMRRLGKAIGAPLVERSGRGVVLTAAGQAFLPGARDALRNLVAARQDVSAIVDPEYGRVSLGFMQSRGVRDVPVLIDGFLAAYPDITFELREGSEDQVLNLVLSCEVDVAIVAPIRDDPRVEAVVMGDERLYLVVDARHRFAKRRHIELREAADENFVGLTRAFGLRQVSDALCHQAGFEPTLAFEGKEIATVRGLIRTGLGVGLLERSLHPEKGIVEIPIKSPVAHREVGAVWLRGRHLPPAAERFINYLKTSGARVLAESH